MTQDPHPDTTTSEPADVGAASRPTRRGVLRAGWFAFAATAVPGTVLSCTTLGNGNGNGNGGHGHGTGGGRGGGHGEEDGDPVNAVEDSAGRVLPSEAPLPEPFRVPLPVPDVLKPVRSDGRTDRYEITQRPADVEILPGRKTRVWGYDGTFPGPTIVSHRGRRTVVTHRNELPVPTVVHLHGGRTAPEHDGYPTDLVLPAGRRAPRGLRYRRGEHGPFARGRREYVYELDQPATTLWYHDHRLDFTGPAVWHGLAGFHLHRDDVEERLDLPSGDREIPLMIADRSFAKDGSFRYPSLDPSLTGEPGVEPAYMSGVLGDVILVNGAPWPVLEVAATTYRFRMLNASNARRYTLKLQDGPRLVQIGSDQGLLERPVEHDELDVAQAERFDVVVDFSDRSVGDEITMVNTRGEDGTAQVMRFRVARRPRAGEEPRPLPARLAPVERLSTADVVTEREFSLSIDDRGEHGMPVWLVNDEEFTPGTVLARPRLGTVERWKVRGTSVAHPFHVHEAPFQVVSYENKGPGASNAGWKDTVSLDEGFHAEFLIRFDGHRGKYVLHCHNLEHEDMMMMANFEVV